MVTFLTVLHIIITISLIFLVLIQDSKGGGMGAFGGGGNSNSVLGASGATSLASKLTQWFAVAFALSCIGLAMTTGHTKKSVVDDIKPTAASPQVSGATATKAEGAAAATSNPVETPQAESETKKSGEPTASDSGKTSEQK